MPKKSYNELKAGLFVVATLLAAVGIIIWLGASGMFKNKGQLVSFYVPQEQGGVGVGEGAYVSLGDAAIGQITSVQFQPDRKRCLYQAQLDRKDILIKADGTANVSSPPIGAARIVILNSGSSSQLADEDHPIRLHGGLDEAMNNIALAAENVRGITMTIQKELSTSEKDTLMSKIHGLTGELQTASGNIAKLSANVLMQTDPSQANSAMAMVAGFLTRANKAAEDVTAMTADARPKVERMMTAMANTADNVESYTKKDVAELLSTLKLINSQLLKIANDFSDVSTQTRQVIVMNRDNIDSILRNMTLVSSNLKATATDVRRNPWKLLYKPDEKEIHSANIYDAARAFASGTEELNESITRLNALAKSSPTGVPCDDPEIQKVRRQIQESFEKFNKAEQSLWKELAK